MTNAKLADMTDVPFGAGRTAKIARLSMGDQFDLAMAIPEGMAGVAGGYANIAASVRMIDNVPTLFPRNRNDVRRTLDQLGEEGVLAVNRALVASNPANASDDAEAALKAQVGNSSEALGSEG